MITISMAVPHSILSQINAGSRGKWFVLFPLEMKLKKKKRYFL